jgi:myo-inositol-1(or 4)-monophosphatase
MQSDQLRILTQKVISSCKKAGAFLKEENAKIKELDIKEKGLHNLVTYADKTSERILVSELSDLISDSGFLTEEGTVEKIDKQYNWIIDPLDGTTNYVHRIPIFSVSVALMSKNEILIGVVYEPNSDECFFTWRGGNSYLNNTIIHVSSSSLIDNSLFATGFPYYDYDSLEAYMHYLSFLMKNSRGIRRMGSAAIDLAYVACGRFDGFYDYGLNAWDVAAGSLIVQNAGGRCYDFSKGDNFVFGKEIVASNENISEEFVNSIKRHFKNKDK